MVPPEEGSQFPRPRRRLVAALAAVTMAAAIWAFLQPAPDDPAGDGRAPDFELPLVGEEGTLSSEELAGSPVVLNFWASWCGPCKDEMPLLERMWRRHRDDGLVIVGVATKDSYEGAEEFVDELGITFPIVHDADRSLTQALGVDPLPQTFFIDDEWRLNAHEAGLTIGSADGGAVLGAISFEALRSGIEDLLREHETGASP